MKKVVYIIAALTAFLLGISVYYIRPLIIPISLSELRENASHYKSRKFKVIGKLEVWEAESVYSINLKDWENDCSGEPICFRGLEVSEELKAENILLLKELAEKNKTLGKTNFISGEYLADVEISGELVETENKYFSGTFYDIKVESMKQTSEIRFVTSEEIGSGNIYSAPL
jgi:hypothetical protein